MTNEAQRSEASDSTDELGGWIKYNGEKALQYPGKHKGRRLLLLIEDADVAIYDFVASAHQDYDGRFWLGVPGSWLGPAGCCDNNCAATHLGDDWTVKAWMPAPEPGAFAHTPNAGNNRSEPNG